MKRLQRDGGSVAPSPGCNPRGAKKNERNPASSSIPSDWYDEKSCSAAMHERNSTVHNATVSLGQTLKTSSSETMRPAPTTRVSAVSLALSQNRVGAYQQRATGPNMPESS